MPKTSSKRARARRAARVTQAHQTRLDGTVRRRTASARSRKRPGGVAGFIRDFPLASTIFAALVVGGIVGLLYTNHLWVWAPAKPKPPVQAVCNLKTHVCNMAPLMAIDLNKIYIATIHTNKGDIVIRMDPRNAPLTVNSFVFLAGQRFYDGLTFHRVVNGGGLFIIQGGDPNGDGSGGPGYSFKDEPVKGNYTTGAVAMANSGANTNGSQFFICTADDTQGLAKKYNLFGYVTQGLDVAQRIVQGDKMITVRIAVVSRSASPAPTPAPTSTPIPTGTPAPTPTVKK